MLAQRRDIVVDDRSGRHRRSAGRHRRCRRTAGCRSCSRRARCRPANGRACGSPRRRGRRDRRRRRAPAGGRPAPAGCGSAPYPSLAGMPIEHLVGGVAVGERPFVARIGEDCGFGPVHAAVGEFVMAADMVEMRVAGDADELSLASPAARGACRLKWPRPGVEQEVAVAAAHMPDVAAEERLDPRLVDQRHAVAHADGLVPVPEPR